MASYIPGITDYIPHLQPFKPDFNFYQAALERKESQYQQGYNKLSSVYGSLLNSPMIREVDNKRRDGFFKDAESNIQKVSEMDLSLEDNVSAAYQIFQPLIDDKHIMKDMAWTKNYQNEVTRAEGFRNCIDEKKCGGKWWEGGVRALNYFAEDFSKSSDDEMMGYEAPRYTPYVNVVDKAMKAAKDMGFNISSVSWSKDGRYIVTQKNGAAMVAPLSQYFVGVFGNDPQVNDVFKTEAYLKRKDFMKSNVATYGSEDAAENFYLNEAMNSLNKETQENISNITGNMNDVDAKQKIIADKINSSGGLNEEDPLIQQYLSLNDQNQALNSARDKHDQTSSYLDRSSLIGADKKATRWRIDNAVANTMLSGELFKAANTFSALNSETKIEADPYAKSSYDSMLRMSEAHSAKLDSLDLMKEEYKLKIDFEQAKAELKKRRRGGIENNTYTTAPEGYQNASATPEITHPQAELNQTEAAEAQKMFSKQDLYLKTLYNHLQSIATSDNPAVKAYEKTSAAADLHKIFGDDYDQKSKKLATDDLIDGKNYKANRPSIYKNALSYSKILDSFYTGLSDKLKPIESDVNLEQQLWSTMDDVSKNNLKDFKTWAQSSAAVPEDKREMLQTLIDDNGKIVDRATFATKWADKHAQSQTQKATSPVSLPSNVTKGVGDYKWQPSKLGTAGTPQPITTHAGSTGTDTHSYGNVHNAAERKYDEIVDLYSKLVRSNPNKVSGNGKTVPVFKAWDGAGQFNFAGGGKAMQPQMINIDGATEDEGLMDAIRVYDAYKQNGALTVSYGYGAKQPSDLENDPGAERVLDTWMEDLKNGDFKDNDLKRPTGKMIYSGVALGDPNKVAFHFIPSTEWAMQKKFTGTAKLPGITGDNKYASGITVYMDKSKVPQQFLSKWENGPYTTLLNHKDILINDYSDAGSITLSKKGSAGVDISGSVNYWDGTKLVPVNASSLNLDRTANADILVKQIKFYMKTIHEQNQMYQATNKPTGPIKNVNQLSNSPQ